MVKANLFNICVCFYAIHTPPTPKLTFFSNVSLVKAWVKAKTSMGGPASTVENLEVDILIFIC